jgi:hypothetical protein
MTDTNYAPPKANLHKPDEKGEPYVPGFDKPMIISIVILFIISVLVTVLTMIFTPEEFDPVNEAVNIIINIFLLFFTVHFIKRLRVSGFGTSTESAASKLGVWGYLWRSFVVQMVSVVLVLIPFFTVLILVEQDLTAFLTTLPATIIIGFALFPITLFCIWGFFSKDRSGQLSGFFLLFSGQ